MTKKEIIKALEGEEWENALSMIDAYEKENPHDYDILTFYTSFYLRANDISLAYHYAKEAVKLNHFNIDANYNMAVVSEASADYLQAFRYYHITKFIQENMNTTIVPPDVLEAEIENIVALEMDYIKSIPEKEKQSKEQKLFDDLVNRANLRFFMDKLVFKKPYHIVGKLWEFPINNVCYIGKYYDYLYSYIVPDETTSVFHCKAEIMPASFIGVEYNHDFESDVLLPVVINYGDSKQNTLVLESNGVKSDISCAQRGNFTYFKVSGKTKINSTNPVLISKPIPLVARKDRKKLVLNIFIDSLSWRYLKENSIEEVMPNTYRFFSKGLTCENVYSSSEYTYPSIATYISGLRPEHHMLLNQEQVLMTLPDDIKILFEYFKDAGYVTAKIGGNSSVTPDCGYARGIDRFLYKYHSSNDMVSETVVDVIDHIKAFEACNQFIWMDIANLHDIAGGFKRTIDVQSKIDPKYYELDNSGPTTVKKTYSENKKHIFYEEAKRLDFYLGILYRYIEDTYADDEMIVTFFSDHGTSYMVKKEEHFLSPTRSNVPLMIRGDGVPVGVCEEYIEICDYSSILCHLAGIQMDHSSIDGQLPKFFGGKAERKYTLTQSFFPKDPYYAALHGKDFKFYLTSKQPCDYDLRVDLAECQKYGVDADGNEITDEMVLNNYISIVKEHIAHLLKY